MMNWCHNRVLYDHWSYMTMLGILEVVFIALREGIQNVRMLFGESREEQAILQENCPLTGYLQMVGQDLVFVFLECNESVRQQVLIHWRTATNSTKIIFKDQGWWIPNFRMRARSVLRLSPRISAAPFLPLTFQLVCSSIRTIWPRSTSSRVFCAVVKSL